MRPKRPLIQSAQKRLWQKLVDSDFRSSMGKFDLDHVVGGGLGESHVKYEMQGVELLIYDTGRVELEIEKVDPTRITQIERIITVILRGMAEAAHKQLNFQTRATLHMRLVNPRMIRFLTENIRFAPSSKFMEAFGAHVILSSFLLRVSNSLEIVFMSPDHLDFLCHGTVSTARNRKPFVTHLVNESMQYLRSISRLT